MVASQAETCFWINTGLKTIVCGCIYCGSYYATAVITGLLSWPQKDISKTWYVNPFPTLLTMTTACPLVVGMATCYRLDGPGFQLR